MERHVLRQHWLLGQLDRVPLLVIGWGHLVREDTMSKFRVKIFETDDLDVRIAITRDDLESISLIFGRDGYFYGSTPFGGGHVQENVEGYIQHTLEDWTK